MKIVDARLRREERCGGAFVECFIDVEYEDGTKEELISFFPDEIRLVPDTFIDMTRDQAIRYYHNEDIAYLRS